MRNLHHALFALPALAGLAGCSLQPFGPQAAMKIVIDPSRVERNLDLASEFLRGPSVMSAPSATSGFDCLAVNVMGPGIANSELSSGGQSGVYNPPSSYCSYAGITTPPIPNTNVPHEANLTVPTGTGRIVQLVGILQGNTTVCSAAGPVGNHTGTNFSTDEYYELGHSMLDIFAATTVSITNSYVQSETLRLNCGGTVVNVASGAGKYLTGSCATMSGTAGTTIGTENFRVEDGTYNTEGGCNVGGGNGYQIFPFDVSSLTVANYSRLNIKWVGAAGSSSSAASCTGSSAPTAGGGKIKIYNGTVWTDLQPTTGAVETLSVSVTNPSTYVVSSVINIAVAGATVTGPNCSNVHTDYIAAKLEK